MLFHSPSRWAAFACSLFVCASSVHADALLVPERSTWRYFDSGANPGHAWHLPAFDDTAWTSGPGILGYGEGSEATKLASGPNAQTKPITAYFRHRFNVADPAAFPALKVRLLRDDGAVVYLNGQALLRENMPADPIAHDTLASATVSGAAESKYFEHSSLGAAALVAGDNVLAVEVHQSAATSSDLAFDLELTGLTAPAVPKVTRGPYLQQATPESIIIRWRTDTPTSSRVSFGPAADQLTQHAGSETTTTEHIVQLTGLTPETRTFYAVGNTSAVLAGPQPGMFFQTPPVAGSSRPARIWVLGDSGTANSNAAAVRDAYTTFTGTRHTDLTLMLGDNAYGSGTDLEYQAAVFNMYPAMLMKSPLWPTLGNHDAGSADSATQSGVYYDIFSLPKNAEAGGLASGTEAYYSYDYANIHFICLDSQGTDRSPGSAMHVWLANDMAATEQDWIIAYFHHPPYTKGSHNSDTEIQHIEMRQNTLPILEAGGVDLVLGGHSHCYERSYLIDGHYGFSPTLTPAMLLNSGDGRVEGDGPYTKPKLGNDPHKGAVQIVAGASGQAHGGPLNHPAMYISLNLMGSLVIDIEGNRMDAVYVTNTGDPPDHFTIIKQPEADEASPAATPASPAAR